jgi:hypothetical protein
MDEDLQKLFTKAEGVSKNPEAYTSAQSGLRGACFRKFDSITKERAGKKLLRSACVYLAIGDETCKTARAELNLTAKEYYNRVSQFAGQWQVERKIKVTGPRGSLVWNFPAVEKTK